MPDEASSQSSQPSIPRPVGVMYVLGFLLGLQIALPAYLLSSFLATYVPENLVGLLFSIASLLTIWAFTALPMVLKKFGNFKSSVAFLLAASASVAALGLFHRAPLIVIAFLASYILSVVLTFDFDIFLEHSSADRVTGEIRGTYLVSINAAWVASQVIAGILLSVGNYATIFLSAAVIGVPALYLVVRHFRDFHDRTYERIPMLKILKTAREHREVIGVYVADTLLQFFYAWMVIYTPLYLHNTVGFDWPHIAVMFAIMLLPFVIIQRPFGELADRKLGEKELMVAGFAVLVVTSGLMPFITTANFLLWTSLLFVSRIGAATVEVMCETYFFKHVTDADVSLIGFFRTARPWGYVLAPLVATLLFPITGLQYLFLALGIIMIGGIAQALALKDTR